MGLVKDETVTVFYGLVPMYALAAETGTVALEKEEKEARSDRLETQIKTCLICVFWHKCK